jgi:hypothetical protein
MSNEAKRASGRIAVALALVLLLLGVLTPGPMRAQVGHAPEDSPFRDITTRQSVLVGLGWFSGNRAEAGVGAQGGLSFNFRLQTRLSGPIDLLASLSYIKSKRYVLDPDLPPATRQTGPIDYNLVATDLGLGLNVTGAKSWHGFAPYVAAGIGIFLPTHSVVDPGGYQAKSNFTFGPMLGVRYLIGSSLGLQVEARDNTIRYEWPLQYFRPTDSSGNSLPITPVLDPTTFDSKQVTHNLSLSVSAIYRFSF